MTIVSKGAALPYCRNSTENQQQRENDPLASVSNVDFSRLPVHRIELDGEANYGRISRLSELRSIHIVYMYISTYIHLTHGQISKVVSSNDGTMEIDGGRVVAMVTASSSEFPFGTGNEEKSPV